MTELKILALHPVQYQVPFFRAIIEAGIDIDVTYFHQGTAGRRARDIEFGIDIEWDMDLLSGYPHRFLTNTNNDYRLQTQLRIIPSMLFWALSDRRKPLLLVGWSLHVIWLVWLLRILFRMPVISFSETTPQSFAASPKPQWRTQLLSWLLCHNDACLYIGSNNRQFLLNQGVDETRLFHTPYSVDNSHYELGKAHYDRQSIRAQFGVAVDLPAFLFVGKLIEVKRTVQLLEAYLAAGLKDKTQLIFVGEGQLREVLEVRAKAAKAKNVHVVGFLNYSQMP
nr:glycosyltransferase [Anaerolineae bacterium]